MQRINFHRPPKIEATELSPVRFLIIAVGSVALAMILLAWNLLERSSLKDELAAVQSELAAAEAKYVVLDSTPLPSTDPLLVAELGRMEARHDYWLSVLELLRNSDTVSMARLDDVLMALEKADSESVWLEKIAINYRAIPTGKLEGRAIHSDASAAYLRSLEQQLERAGLTVTHMLVTAKDAEPLKFEATLKLVEPAK